MAMRAVPHESYLLYREINGGHKFMTEHVVSGLYARTVEERIKEKQDYYKFMGEYESWKECVAVRTAIQDLERTSSKSLESK